MTAVLPPTAPQSAPAPADTPNGAIPAADSAPEAAAPDAAPKADAPRDPSTGHFLRVKPIKLPGVHSRVKEGSKTMVQEIDEARAAQRTQEATDAGKDEGAPDAAPADAKGEGEPAPPSKVKFDGKEFDSHEAATAYAEAQLKTARNSQAAASRNAQLQANRAKQEIEQQYVTRLAALEQRILQQPAADADPNNAPPDPTEQQFWAEILQARQSASLITDPAARAREELLIQYAAANFITEKRMAELEARINTRFEPFEQTQAQSAEFAAANTLFEGVAAFHNPTDNSPQFPELLDNTDAEGVIQIWHNQTRGMKAEDRMDPRQVVLAVLAYRALKAEMTKGAPKPATPAPPAPRPPAPPAPRPAANGAVLQQSNITGAPRTTLPGGQILPGVWPRGNR